jgi:hypothetical protein
MIFQLVVLLIASSPWTAMADVYLHNPRGSNNKLSEESNNVQNDNRLFDSQNNAASGYQVGDGCKPVCQNENGQYDETKEGAMKGAMMFYQGSELYIEWTHQHGCGVGHNNVKCQIILQYMSEKENPQLRDGTKRGNQNNAGGQQEPPTIDDASDPTLGQHESLDYYLGCKNRERNKGLYTSDQGVRNDRGATATRQNPQGSNNAGQRHGLECPEERDYYPYWHPSPWHDIAVFTEEPHARCPFYQRESQNVRSKGFCSTAEFNNPRACEVGGGKWSETGAFGDAAPSCVGAVQSRDNHNGNVRNGENMYHLWRIPDDLEGLVVLRIRYNITTGDMAAGATINRVGPASTKRDVGEDFFFVDSSQNDPNPGQRRRSTFSGGPPIVSQDPRADFVNLGDPQTRNRELQVQFNTNQVARTFEDRSHIFSVRKRPSDVAKWARIVNYNVRGRRGNIVQVYPAVEYDFVPPALTVGLGTLIHFQWVGSDANQAGNAGNGRDRTDRSNLVQIAGNGENIPLPIEEHTLLFNSRANPDDPDGRALVDRFAYLDQEKYVACDADENNDNAIENCKQLNGASAYFDGGLVAMSTRGTHHIASTRNNDFSNRSQKASITVVYPLWVWFMIAGLCAGVPVLVLLLVYIGIAVFAFTHPTSFLFSKKHRPRVLRWCCSRARVEQKIEERRQSKRLQERTSVADDSVWGVTGVDTAQASDVPTQLSKPHVKPTRLDKWRSCGFGEQRLALFVYSLVNVAVFLIGFLGNFNAGFRGSLSYPFAKGGGFVLDLNFAFVVLPTLKSIQTTLRTVAGTREWIPIDDPISFHIAIACFIALGSVLHIVAHCFHIADVAAAPPLQSDPLALWGLGNDDLVSGTPVWLQMLDLRYRCAPVTGVLVAVLMLAMFITAMPCARRGTNSCSRRLGGYNLFWSVHSSWILIYVLLLIHAPDRLWIWLFFPAVFVAVDRVMLAQRQRPYAALREARLLPRDVISLSFEIPEGFAYEAGQYVHLGWRGEWHPFTLTSAPEEGHLSLHIRAPESLDWCSALRRRLLVEAPVAAAQGLAKDTDLTSSVGKEKIYRYRQHVCPWSGVSFCRPILASKVPKTDEVAVPVNCHRPRSGESLVPAEKAPLPADAVVLQLCGPFGAPAQKVWQFDTIMVVGSGIGVTPFASILRSVQLRAKQRQALEELARARSNPGPTFSKPLMPMGEPARAEATVAEAPPQLGGFWSWWANGVGAGGGEERISVASNDANAATMQKTVTNTPPSACDEATGGESTQNCGADETALFKGIVTLPKRIYFYWVVRSQEEFDWFHELLAAAFEGPAKDIVHINVFMTGEVEIAQVRELPFVKGHFFGRPNWNRIFKQNKEYHSGEHVGVFLCGSPALGQELSVQSDRHTDPPGTSGTRFSFYKEHF